MNVITQRDLIKKVASSWKSQYGPFPKQMACRIHGADKSTQQIYDALDALDVETATPEDVASIIGNKAWTRLTCNECQRDVEAVIQVGEAEDYESNTAMLCRECVEKAFSMMCINMKTRKDRRLEAAEEACRATRCWITARNCDVEHKDKMMQAMYKHLVRWMKYAPRAMEEPKR